LCARVIRSINKDKDKIMRILGITIPETKRLEIGLTTLFGIGRSRAKQILDQAKIDWGVMAKDLTPAQENDIKKIIESLKIEGDLKREVSGNIKRLKDIKCYRGLRHIRSLPVRGQRTKTNSRTRRGNVRKTMGTGRRAVEKK
jgi:small subunit ribosomal protein S13